MLRPIVLIRLLWLAFVLCWLVFAQFNKKTSRKTPVSAAWYLRLAILIGVLMIVRFRRHAIAGFFASLDRSLPLHSGIPLQWVGVGLALAGFGVAVWARVSIGRNWGMPMSLREDHELVTSGPYAYIRHPIYSGLMLAMIGSAFTAGLLWLLGPLVYFIYFIFAARSEEKTMLTEFPDAYPAYRRRTKMLIPFVL